jgi:hypothetical protein
MGTVYFTTNPKLTLNTNFNTPVSYTYAEINFSAAAMA